MGMSRARLLPRYSDSRYTQKGVITLYCSPEGTHELIEYGQARNSDKVIIDFADCGYPSYNAADVDSAWRVSVVRCELCQKLICGRLDDRNRAIEHYIENDHKCADGCDDCKRA